MPVIAGLLLLIQVAFAIHVVRTGRDRFWIYIIIFVPAVGCLVYFFTQVLPEMGQSHAVRKVGNGLLKAVDPERELRQRKEALELSDTIENRMRLADECMEAGFAGEAIKLLEGCLKGGLEHDPAILYRLANAQFANKNYQLTKETLERLMRENPDFKSPDGHLLFARTLEELGLLDQAIEEYQVLATSYPGEEARVRYGMLLQKQGKTEQADEQFKECLLRVRRAPKYYRKKEARWIKIARDSADIN